MVGDSAYIYIYTKNDVHLIKVFCDGPGVESLECFVMPFEFYPGREYVEVLRFLCGSTHGG